MYLDLCIIVLSAVGGCYFAACHTALKTFSRKRLTDLLEARGKQAKLDKTVQQIDGLLLITGVLRVALSITLVLGTLAYISRQFPTMGDVGRYVLAFFLAGVVLGVFGVAIPTSWAAYRRERLLVWSLPILHTLRVLFWPLTIGLRLIDPVVRRISGVDLIKEEENNPITEEVLTVVEDRDPEASVDQAQKQMLEAVFELPTTTAEAIMTPRTDVKGIEIGATLEEVRTAIIEAGHSRMPVYAESVDHIQGMLYAKDLIASVAYGQASDTGQPNPTHVSAKANGNMTDQTLVEPATFDLRSLLREPYMVPESKSVSELLSEFKAQKIHMAVVLDEYGGTAGLVTIEDILEEIVGEIQDEYEDAADQPPEIHTLDESTCEVEARVYIDDLNDAMQIELPENEDYETVGGFVLSKLGHIPEQGETLTFEHIRFTVTAAERTRVSRVKIEKLESTDADTHSAAKEVEKAT